MGIFKRWFGGEKVAERSGPLVRCPHCGKAFENRNAAIFSAASTAPASSNAWRSLGSRSLHRRLSMPTTYAPQGIREMSPARPRRRWRLPVIAVVRRV